MSYSIITHSRDGKYLRCLKLSPTKNILHKLIFQNFAFSLVLDAFT